MVDQPNHPSDPRTEAEKAADKARGHADRLKHEAEATGEQLKGEAARLAESAKAQAEQAFTAQKKSITGQIEGYANALRQTASTLDEQDQRTVAVYTRQAADGLDNIAHSLDARDPGDLVDDVQRLAHERPAAFIGGAAALGFVLSRFLKSSAERQQRRQRERYGTAYGQTTPSSPSYGAPSTPPTSPGYVDPTGMPPASSTASPTQPTPTTRPTTGDTYGR